MNIDLENRAGIVPEEHPELLADIQGNILKGHGKDRVRLLFIEFTAEAALARKWLHAFGTGMVTPASEQDRQAANWLTLEEDSVFANLFLTSRGYRYLGVDDAQMPSDSRFRAGMLGSQAALQDPPGSEWDPPYDPETHPIHAMVLLAASTATALERRSNYVETSLAPLARVRPQAGQMIREKAASQAGATERYVEHLNFLDGRSQPLFFRKHLDEEAQSGGIDKYDPSAPLSLVLVKEPDQADGRPNGYGSYLVYRKLEQNVRGFKEREHELGDDDRQRIGAMVVGRFENGTPIELAPRDSLTTAPNNFNYDDDPAGRKCPLFAHIRKVNQRTPDSRQHRIARRGATYDDIGRAAPPTDEAQTFDQMPDAGVGLLFMCFQSSIENQFEYLQQSANDPNFPIVGAGMDPLAGQAGTQGKAALQWPRQWDADTTVGLSFGSFVRLKGGEYFFAPSRSFFAGLTDSAS